MPALWQGLEVTPEEPCNHLEVIRDDYPGWQYDYCPKCGEKL